MKQEIQVLTPDDSEHAVAIETVERSRKLRVDYNEIATAYNKSPVGSLLLVNLYGYRSIKTSNFVAILGRRGLEVDKDFRACKVMADADGVPIPSNTRPMSLEKLTNTRMRLTR